MGSKGKPPKDSGLYGKKYFFVLAGKSNQQGKQINILLPYLISKATKQAWKFSFQACFYCGFVLLLCCVEICGFLLLCCFSYFACAPFCGKVLLSWSGFVKLFILALALRYVFLFEAFDISLLIGQSKATFRAGFDYPLWLRGGIHLQVFSIPVKNFYLRFQLPGLRVPLTPIASTEPPVTREKVTCKASTVAAEIPVSQPADTLVHRVQINPNPQLPPAW